MSYRIPRWSVRGVLLAAGFVAGIDCVATGPEQDPPEPPAKLHLAPAYPGSKILSEDTITLTWDKELGATGGVRVFFSKDSGKTWPDTLETIQSGLTARVVVPLLFTQTENCRFKVAGDRDTVLSEAYTVKNLVLVRPATDTSFRRGDTLIVEWAAHPSVTSVAAYLVRLGKPELLLMESASVTTSMPSWPHHSWVIPDTVSGEVCLVRIEDYLDPITSDINSDAFSIE